ncbi:MAG: glycine oxidase ThiO [Planctomyces sp.]|nr:glycine oxidase ThiO [Planctomyces sp.]
MHDVLIIGGGVMGLTTAWELAKTGLRVAVLDRAQPGREASWAGAGILPPGHRGDPNDPLAPLLRRATELWPEVTDALRDQTGIDNGFRRCGEIQVLEDPARLESDLDGWRINGVRAEPLSAEALRDLEPAASRDVPAAYVLPDACQVRNPWHVRALGEACRAAGVEIVCDREAVGFHMSNGRVDAVRTAAGDLSAGAFLVAGGAWSGEILKSIGRALELEPVRGQMVLLKTPSPLIRHILEIGARYVVPRTDGRLLIGSTEEWVGFVKQNTAGGVAGLVEFGRRLVPGLSEATLEACWSGLRPHTRRGTPFLGAMPECSNLFLAAGHFRAGLHLSTVTGRLMAQAIRGEEPELSLRAFAVNLNRQPDRQS